MTGREPDNVGAERAEAAADAEALRRLERRLDEAAEAAERLLADAAERVAGRRPPAAGWQRADAGSRSGSGSGSEWELGFGSGSGRGSGFGPGADGWIRPADAELLLGLLGTVRDRIPPELQQRLADAVREVLLAIRALIDWYLERTERGRREPTEVEDIPIL